MHASPSKIVRRSGFTLVELLAVIAVIAVVIAFAVPSINQILRGSQMSQGGQLLGDQFSYARQLAITKNRTIEFRIYRFGDPDTPGEKFDDPTTGYWRAFQLFEILDNGAALPAGEFKRMPRMVVIDPSERSTLLDPAIVGDPNKAKSDMTAPELPVEVNGKRVGRNYEWIGFRFLPDGSTNLPLKAVKSSGTDKNTDAWYVTVVAQTDLKRELKGVNFVVLQIDPVTGSQKTFRPTAGK